MMTMKGVQNSRIWVHFYVAYIMRDDENEGLVDNKTFAKDGLGFIYIKNTREAHKATGLLICLHWRPCTIVIVIGWVCLFKIRDSGTRISY